MRKPDTRDVHVFTLENIHNKIHRHCRIVNVRFRDLPLRKQETRAIQRGGWMK